MKKQYISSRSLIIVILLATLFTGCSNHNTPPNVNSVQEQFITHQDDIQTIIEFMIDSGYENIYIQDAKGSMLADLTKVQIYDEKVSAAITKILGNEKYIQISKIGNTISFLQWRGIRDIGCGIAYTINGFDTPEIAFMTDLVSISDNGWFYYVSDYNRWRNNTD